MNAEGTRQPERFLHYWKVPAGLRKEEAEKVFREKIKPPSYTYEKFYYDHRSGTVSTL